MKIIIDTREKAPLKFGCDFTVKKLSFGDYGCMFSSSYQYPVVWERKSVGDLYGSLTFQYERFKRMFLRAERANYKVIIAIEGTREKVLKGYPHSARNPESVIKQLETIKLKYDVSHEFFATRSAMAHYITDYYLIHYEEYKSLISQAQLIANKDSNND